MLSSESVENVLTQVIQEKFAAIESLLNERTRRRWAAVEARALGRGGIARVAEATGLSRATISAGLQELATGPEDDDAAGRLRGPGAGRKALAEHDADLVAALERLVDPATRGDPTGPLRWTCSSAARLSRELQEAGHRVSERSVDRLLHALGYSLQANRKTLEGKQHPDRDAQFNHINRRVRAFQRRRQPVVSVDTKKKELVGPFKNAGREWRPRGQAEPVRVHDFLDKALGKAIPYGVYDLTHDAGWVSVGVDHDTASFAVETLRRWWRRMGCVSYPVARRLLITAEFDRQPQPSVEVGAAAVRRRDGAAGLGVPLSAWDEQVEQDRAPDVLSQHGELAGPAVGESGGGGEPDRPHDDAERLGDSFRVGREQLPDGPAGDGGTDGESFAQAGQVSRRLELQS